MWVGDCRLLARVVDLCSFFGTPFARNEAGLAEPKQARALTVRVLWHQRPCPRRGNEVSFSATCLAKASSHTAFKALVCSALITLTQ